MQHFAGAGTNPRALRDRRNQPAQNYDFVDDSDSEDFDDDDAQQQGGRLRRFGNAHAHAAAAGSAPRDAAAVIQDIKRAVSSSLSESCNRERGLIEGTYDLLLDHLLSVGEALKAAGAPHDAVIGAAERVVAVQKGAIARSTALAVAARGYDPSRFVAGTNDGEGPSSAAVAGAGSGAGEATDFAAALAAGGRMSRRRARARAARNIDSDDDDDDDDDDEDKDSDDASVGGGVDESDPVHATARNSLADLGELEERLHDLRGFAPEEELLERDGVTEVRGGRGGGGGAAGDAAGGGATATLGGARNARCPLTSKPLADIQDPVEDANGFVYERAAVEGYVLSETGRRWRTSAAFAAAVANARRAGAAAAPTTTLPAQGAPASAYPAEVVELATREGVVAPVAGTNHRVTLGALRPARRLLRELAARRARAAAAAAGGGRGGGGGGRGGGGREEEGGAGGGAAGADADIEISE